MWYKTFLEDKNRLSHLRKAILTIVKPGDIVIDIGSGMGTLSFFACQAGAKKVYAIEASDAIDVAREIAKHNKFSDRITFIKKNSGDLKLTFKADAIISEIIGFFGIDSEITRSLADAKKRLLKKNGKLIPNKIVLYLVPVYFKDLYEKQISFKKQKYFGISFEACEKFYKNQTYMVDIKLERIPSLSSPNYTYNFYENDQENISFESSFVSSKSQTIYGYLGWYDYYLTNEIKLTNKPGTKNCWGGQSFFPLESPVKLNKNDQVIVKIDGFFLGNRFFWSWKTEISGSEGNTKAKFSQNNIDEYYAKKLLQKK